MSLLKAYFDEVLRPDGQELKRIALDFQSAHAISPDEIGQAALATYEDILALPKRIAGYFNSKKLSACFNRAKNIIRQIPDYVQHHLEYDVYSSAFALKNAPGRIAEKGVSAYHRKNEEVLAHLPSFIKVDPITRKIIGVGVAAYVIDSPNVTSPVGESVLTTSVTIAAARAFGSQTLQF